MDDVGFKKAPAPWRCTADVYAAYFFSSPKSKAASDIDTIAYSPLERESSFASPEGSRFAGGVGSFMLLRYSDTPVGTYDELIIIPGAYTYQMQDKKGTWVEKKGPRVTRIYVSQKDTMYNGRLNWNIPKHLARFEWKDLPNGAKHCKVFPHDTGGDPSEASPSTTPFFQASFKTVPLLPSFPLSTRWFEYLGVNTALAQPPVPQGPQPEAVGTGEWCRCELSESAPRTHVGWMDLSQRDEEGKLTGLYENFWPGMGRWQVAVRMDNAVVDIKEGEHWRPPRANL